MFRTSFALLAAMAAVGAGAQTPVAQIEPVPAPKVAGLVQLFDGTAPTLTANWVKRGTDKPAEWKLDGGAMLALGGDIQTKAEYADFQLHIEFRTPNMPDAKGQGKGNSGIGLQGRYEVQVLDSFGIETPGKGDCGALYNLSAPIINACRPPTVWQTYDIVFRAGRFDAAGAMTTKPLLTVIQNGTVVQNNVEVPDMTGIQYQQFKGPAKSGPIVLQDHGNRVEYRNIWIIPLPEKGSDKY